MWGRCVIYVGGCRVCIRSNFLKRLLWSAKKLNINSDLPKCFKSDIESQKKKKIRCSRLTIKIDQ